ncbi:MAG: DUF3159 domain-containing protein [Anaerolineales bacterium]
MSKLNELKDEFQSVLSGRVPLLDVVLPPLLFTLLNGLLSFTAALFVALAAAGILLGARLWRKQSFSYTLGGVAITVIAGVLAWISQSAKSFFLPGVISSGITFLASLASLIARRPLAAWSSHLTRGWPLKWYWHPQVRPAYSEVTMGWSAFFGMQFLIQAWFYWQRSAQSLGIIQLLIGWPVLILVLALSYLYGLQRLKTLQGPSVEEFQEGKDPPWEGQQRGF